VCGTGNNGGDGFVIARLLRELDFDVRVALLGARERLSGDAALHFGALVRSGVVVVDDLSDEPALARWIAERGDVALAIDAIFGTGLRSEVTGIARRAIEWLGDAGVPVVAIDIPSGVDATTGRILGIASTCALTVTFGFPKLGHVLPPGSDRAGTVRVVDIGIPRALTSTGAVDARLITRRSVADRLPSRPAQAHKGSFGHVLVIAGSRGLEGAGALACLAALRAGAGLTTWAGPAGAADRARIAPEIMTVRIPDLGHGRFGIESLADVERAAQGKTAVALGPGLGRDPDTGAMVRRLVATLTLPMIVDADALHALAGDPSALAQAPAPRVLTPHPGEMAGLAGCSTADVQSDRIGVARRFAREHRAHLVLKGAGTVVAHPDGRVGVNQTGNPGMATGGMGDVLTGILGSLLAQRVPPDAAAEIAVYLHGAAGDRVASEIGTAGLLASEVANSIPRELADLKLGRAPAAAPRIDWVEAP